jgi:DNA-binding Lrp family transcriptional regulator
MSKNIGLCRGGGGSAHQLDGVRNKNTATAPVNPRKQDVIAVLKENGLEPIGMLATKLDIFEADMAKRLPKMTNKERMDYYKLYFSLAEKLMAYSYSRAAIEIRSNKHTSTLNINDALERLEREHLEGAHSILESKVTTITDADFTEYSKDELVAINIWKDEDDNGQ